MEKPLFHIIFRDNFNPAFYFVKGEKNFIVTGSYYSRFRLGRQMKITGKNKQKTFDFLTLSVIM